jgi:quinol monooxygenase YgiN
MVGRIWEFTVDPERAAAFEEFSTGVALPMVRGKMGCSAVYVLREEGMPGRYGWVTLWVSRKALLVAAASPEWEELRTGFAALGVPFDLGHARAFDTLAAFRAGETA